MRCVHAKNRCGAYHKIRGSASLSLSSAAMIIKSRKEIIKSIAVIKSMNFYNRSTTIIKSMIIKKKTTTVHYNNGWPGPFHLFILGHAAPSFTFLSLPILPI
jgi:hypothetical protein